MWIDIVNLVEKLSGNFMIFSFLFHTAFAEPVFVPKPEVRGAATQAHVDDFFRTLTKELSIDKSFKGDFNLNKALIQKNKFIAVATGPQGLG